MIIGSAFISEVANKLGIHKEPSEETEQWYKRVYVSMVGGHMLAALYDFDEDTVDDSLSGRKTVSMKHVLKCGNDIVSALEIVDCDCEKIRKNFITTGFMLHNNNRLTYPSKTTADSGDISFIRGVPPWDKIFMSGVATYLPIVQNGELSVERMFGLEEHTTDEWFGDFEKRLKWEEIDHLPDNVEYINIKESAKKNYWQKKPPKQGLTLCRTTGVGETEYSMLRIYASMITKSILPAWQVENGEYRRIAIALRSANGNIPSVTVKRKIHIAEIVTDYLLPYREQCFLEVYSWATESDSHWKRTIALKLYLTFKRMFKNLGYQIYEE